MTVRLTCIVSINCDSVGSLSPGLSALVSICSVNRLTTNSARLRARRCGAARGDADIGYLFETARYEIAPIIAA
jgi:hypothetical protein